MEPKRQNRQKKDLSAAGLLRRVRKTFAKIVIEEKQDPRGKKTRISLADNLMSGLAMFSLKSPSLFAFDKSRMDKVIKYNLETLFKIKDVSSDTHLRKILDEVNPTNLRSAFLSLFEVIQRGKLLEEYRFLNGYLIACDGTGLFYSEKVNCENCCIKNHQNERKSYYHKALAAVVIHPEKKQVLPLCPEMINKQDGTTKNDCEQRAMQRFLTNFKREHPRLKATFALDALYSTAPQINLLTSLGYDYIIRSKKGNNKLLFEFMQGIELSEKNITVGQNTYEFRYINNVPLNGTVAAPEVNFLECNATETKGKKVKTINFTWITNHKITDDNVYLLMKGGRVRWKVENETFNTLKNHGYQFEHNFGHGKKHLTAVFATLMMLAFAIDQIQEASCGLFQAALTKRQTRRDLWEKMRGIFSLFFVNSWKDLFRAIAEGAGATLAFDTS